MTGAIAEFIADLREVYGDPSIDLDTLPPEIVEPIRAWVDEYRNSPRFERRVHLGWINFTIRIPPRGSLIRASELKAVFSRHTELAAASERAIRQQAAELEVENDLALAQGRAASIKEALLLAARAEARAQVQWQLDNLFAQKTALSQHVDELIVETAALKKEIARLRALDKHRSDTGAKLTALEAEKSAALQRIIELAHERDVLALQMQRQMAGRQTMEEERADLHRRLKVSDDLNARFVVNAKGLLADYDTLAEQVKNLRTENNVLKNENARWKAQAKGEARAATDLKIEREALTLRVKTLAANTEELERANSWLQEKLRFREQAPHQRWRHSTRRSCAAE